MEKKIDTKPNKKRDTKTGKKKKLQERERSRDVKET